MTIPKLVVEGKDDFHVVGHLLLKHNYDFMDLNSPIKIVEAKSDYGVLRLASEVESSIGQSVGLVIDADEDVESRVQSLCDRLSDVVTIDKAQFLKNGFFVEQRKDNAEKNVGGWIMPGEGRVGKLEVFLKDLIPRGDKMLEVAEVAVADAQKVGALFDDKDEIKALIHVWLGLQKSPGRPMGLAVKCQYFDSNAELARSFVKWVTDVFSL